MSDFIQNSLAGLKTYVEKKGFCGYDPYDTLNSYINFKIFGKLGTAVFIQIQKRNPVNIRPLLGVKKGFNPKGMGLFLKAYAVRYRTTGDVKERKKADQLFEWLDHNFSRGYSGKCWGYNFDWANPEGTLPTYTPSVVVSSFVVDGIFEYYKLTQSQQAKEAIISAAEYVRKDIPVTELPDGISFSYTHLSKGACYNASLLAAEVLAKAQVIEGTSRYNKLIEKAVRFVLSKQNPDNSWFYSFDPETGRERRQLDFHQGFVLVSLHNLLKLTGILREQIEGALRKGLRFYRERQFLPSGRSMGRLPKKWPVDIHNQSQGI